MSNRMERANSEIQSALANILENKLNDPRLAQFITIMAVNTTPDFKYCKVDISMLNATQEELSITVNLLNKSEGFIKRELANAVKMPSVPKIMFELDKGTANSIRINEILKTLEIKAEETDVRKESEE